MGPREIRSLVARIFKEQDKRQFLLKDSARLAEQARANGMQPNEFRKLLKLNFQDNQSTLKALLDQIGSEGFQVAEKTAAQNAAKIKWKPLP